MNITVWDVLQFFCYWLWVAVLIGLCFGEWVRRHQP